MVNESDHHVPPDSKPAKSGRVGRIIRRTLIVILSLVLVAMTAAGLFVTNLAHSFDSKVQVIEPVFPPAETRPQKPVPAPTQNPLNSKPEPMNILVLGEDAGGASPEELTVQLKPGSRADTIMLVHLAPDRRKIFIMSVMRDLWVDIPGHGEAKINAALAFGGVPLLVQALEAKFHARIDHVAALDFAAFKGLTDALGGVTVDSPLAFKSKRYSFVEGPNRLDGAKALRFVRERYAFPDGDYQRVRNQQAFIRALIARMKSQVTPANPLGLQEVVDVVSPYIAVDAQLDAARIAMLALELRDVGEGDILTFTLPTAGTGWSADGQSIVVEDPRATSDIARALADESLEQYLENSGLASRN